MSNKNYSASLLRKAFTLVEVLVVITVIAILLGVSIFVSTKYQQTARDSEREAKATVLSTALEKYYETNSEYPSCNALIGDPSTVKSSTLTNIADVSVFEAPGAASGVNSIQCTADVAAVSKDKFTYTCTNASTPCDGWELKYRKESDSSIVSIASAAGDGATSSEGAPTVTLSSAISGTNAVATASTSCTTGEPEYQIRYYKNSGSFPGTWTNGSSATVPVYEGEGATFQAQARCLQFGFDPTSYTVSSASTANRAVTAPTGLTTTVAISGANATGTVTGGTCATGPMILDRQIQHLENSYLYGGAWSGLLDIAGTTQTLAVDEGWQMNFHQQARCRNTTTNVASGWTWGPVGNAIRPINQIGAPSVGYTVYPAKVVFNWTGGGNPCPNSGTTKEYRFQLGSGPDWWGPTTDTSFEWLDGSQGWDYTLKVQQRCTSGYVSSPWSASDTATYSRPVSDPGQATGFTKDTPYGNVGIAFNWNAPTCGTGAYPQYRMDWANGGGTGILWMDRRSDGWWFGGSGTAISASNPSTAWTDSYPTAGFGYMADKGNAYAPNPPRMDLDAGVDDQFDKDNQIGISVQYRCRNGYTGVTSDPGPKNGMIYTWP